MADVIVRFPGPPVEQYRTTGSLTTLRALSSTSMEEGDNILVETGDVGGTTFVWEPTSLLTDDGVSIVKPNDKTSLQAGRWIAVSNQRKDMVSVLDYIPVSEHAAIVGGTSTADLAGYCQLALNTGKDVLFPKGTYWLNTITQDAGVEESCIHPVSNQKIIFESGVVLRAIPNSLLTYYLIDVRGVENVTIEGNATLIGDRDDHTDAGGESGMGVAVYNSTNITVRGVRCQDFWGDGIYVGGTDLTGTSRNVVIEHVVCDNNRRNGMTVAAVDGCTIVGGQYNNSNGVVGAECGIDFEANISGALFKAPVKNVTCYGVIARGNTGPGFGVANPHVSYLEFYGCEARDNGDAGFYFGVAGPGCKIFGGRSIGNATHGVYAFGAAPTVTTGVQVIGLDAHSNTLDGIYFAGQVMRCSVEGGQVSLNGRHGIHLERTLGSFTDLIEIKGALVYNNSQTTDLAADNIHIGSNCHFVRALDCTVRKNEPTSIIASVTTTPSNRPRYGINVVDNEATIDVQRNDVTNGGQTANMVIQPLNIVKGNTGFRTENRVLSANVDISATGNKTVTIPHGLAYTPSVEHCQVTIVDTASAGGDFQPPRIQSADATNVTARLNVLTAVAAANVKLALAVERP